MAEREVQVLFLHDATRYTQYLKYAGVYKIKSEAVRAGFTAQVIDVMEQLSFEKLLSLVLSFIGKDTLVLAFSSTFLERSVDKENNKTAYSLSVDGHGLKKYLLSISGKELDLLVQEVKAVNPKIKIVVGGSNAEAFLYHPRIDVCFTGMSDASFTAYLRDLSQDKPFNFSASLTLKKNLVKGEEHLHNYSGDLGILWEDRDIIRPYQSLPIEFSRGCMFKCSYCSHDLNGKSMDDWTRKSSFIQQELIRNYEKFGVTKYVFADDMINDSMERVKYLHKIITDLPFKIEFGSFARLDVFDKHFEMAYLLREMGAKYLTFGIETFDKKAGATVGKGYGTKSVALLHKLREAMPDTLFSSGFIVGLPTATEEQIRFDLKTARDCLDAYIFYPLKIKMPGLQNRMFLDPQKYGYTLTETGAWQGTNMTSKDAERLSMECNVGVSKRRVSFGNYYGQLNLGMSNTGVETDPVAQNNAAQAYFKSHIAALHNIG